MKFNGREINFLKPSDTSFITVINELQTQFNITELNSDKFICVLTWILLKSEISTHEQIRLSWTIGKKLDGVVFDNEKEVWTYMITNMYVAMAQVEYLSSIDADYQSFNDMEALLNQVDANQFNTFLESYKLSRSQKYKSDCNTIEMMNAKATKILNMMDAYQRRLDAYPESDSVKSLKQQALNELRTEFRNINYNNEEPFYQFAATVARQSETLSMHRDHFQFLMKISATLHQKANQLYGTFFASEGHKMATQLKNELPEIDTSNIPMSILKPSA